MGKQVENQLKDCDRTSRTHPVTSRSCGGSHTVISASQQRASLQHMKRHSQTEVDGWTRSKQVGIVGLDKHIYVTSIKPQHRASGQQDRQGGVDQPPTHFKKDPEAQEAAAQRA